MFMQIFIIGILAVVGAGLMWFMSSGQNPSVTTTTPTPIVRETNVPEQTTDTPVANTPTSPYKDGTYSTAVTYISPGGDEPIDVSLTLKDGVITDASFAGTASNPTSMNYQEKFAKGFKAKVVGAPLADLKLTVVNGASLTTKGFMDAVDAIKQDAAQS